MGSVPPVRRRLVGRELRRYREALGLTLEDAAVVLECDRSKVSRIETGERGIRLEELRKLLGDYGVTGEERRILTLLVDPHGASRWFSDYASVLPAAWQDYLTMETAVTGIAAYEAQQIPGLLQTRAYARAVAEANPFLGDDASRDRAADAVIARRKAILRDRDPWVHIIVGRAALHQKVASPQVMDRQLKALARMTGRVALQILPFESGAHAAVGDGSLAILHFAEAPGLGLVHLGGIGGGVCLEGRDHLETYTQAFQQLRAYALSPARSAELLRDLAGN
jgi:transcriptional regulator with XRE-family HTH domain